MRENSQNFRGNPDKKADCFVAKIVNAPRNDGFTLAEVLITLVIIGVIAAITVPSLINKTQNQEYVSKLKKAYSTLAQATNLIIAEEGTPRADKGGWADNTTHIFDLYKNKLHNARLCVEDRNTCMANNSSKLLNGNPSSFYTDYRNKMVLSDGSILSFGFSSTLYSECNQTIGGSDKVCYLLQIDINGARKPNIFGKDIFQFVLKEQGLYPSGCESGLCPQGDGTSCACKVLREGAINY